MTVQIGFSTSNAWISRAIRFFTRAKVSHAFLTYNDITIGEPMVMEADYTGYHLRSFKSATLSSTIVVLSTPKSPIDGILPLCAGWLDKPYDYLGIVGFIWVCIGRWCKAKWHSPLHDSKALFCSESIVLALQDLKYPHADKLVAVETSPDDLLNFMKAEGDVVA